MDDSANPGTHWVAYKKVGNVTRYYDSFGDLPPPLELIAYLRRGGSSIQYNYDRHQKFGTYNCGHLCLKFLLDDDTPSA